MKMGPYDVVIAGAGPAGLHAAWCCERYGLNVLVLEKRMEIGKPSHCSGLISSNISSFVPVKSDFVEHKVSGAVIHSPGGGKAFLEKNKTAAFVIDRVKFDRYLASRLDSRILLGSAIDDFEVSNDKVTVFSGKREIESSVLMGCDGANSFVRHRLGAKPAEKLQGIIAVKGEEDYSDHVDLWFDKRLCDGFIWRIPRARSVEYGMIGSSITSGKLGCFFGLKGNLKMRGGMVPLGPPKTYFNRVLLVGDAAAQVKPWSGGGVVYSMAAAGIAAKTVRDAKEANDFSEPFLKRYERGWKRKMGRQIKAGMLARGMLKHMSNAQIDLAMNVAGRMHSLMNGLDMDFILK